MDDAEIIGAEAAEPEPMDLDEMRIMALEHVEEDFMIATVLMDELHMLNEDNFLFFCSRYMLATAGYYSGYVSIKMSIHMHIPYIHVRSARRMEWEGLDMSREQAMTEFMEGMDDINPDWRSLLDARRSSATGLGHRVSIMLAEEEEEDLSDHEKSIFDWCKEGNVEEVQRLLSRENANIDQVDENGLTLLHWACDRGHLEVVNLLIERGVNMNALDPDDQTPLHYACTCEHLPIIEALVKHGSNINARDTDGNTPADNTYREDIHQLLGDYMVVVQDDHEELRMQPGLVTSRSSTDSSNSSSSTGPGRTGPIPSSNSTDLGEGEDLCWGDWKSPGLGKKNQDLQAKEKEVPVSKDKDGQVMKRKPQPLPKLAVDLKRKRKPKPKPSPGTSPGTKDKPVLLPRLDSTEQESHDDDAGGVYEIMNATDAQKIQMARQKNGLPAITSTYDPEETTNHQGDYYSESEVYERDRED